MSEFKLPKAIPPAHIRDRRVDVPMEVPMRQVYTRPGEVLSGWYGK